MNSFRRFSISIIQCNRFTCVCHFIFIRLTMRQNETVNQIKFLLFNKIEWTSSLAAVQIIFKANKGQFHWLEEKRGKHCYIDPHTHTQRQREKKMRMVYLFISCVNICHKHSLSRAENKQSKFQWIFKFTDSFLMYLKKSSKISTLRTFSVLFLHLTTQNDIDIMGKTPHTITV